MSRPPAAPPVRPAQLCAALLAALDASEGRTRRRKRDQTPDRIGLGIKRALLTQAVHDDPAPADFEGWLLERCLAPPALDVLQEWRLARRSTPFQAWLGRGAPSDDAAPGTCRDPGHPGPAASSA